MGNYDSYLIDGEVYVSVSTILNCEGKGNFLTKWALNKFGVNTPTPYQDYQSWMDGVAGTGTLIHKFIEYDLKNLPFPENEYTEELVPIAELYYDWKLKNGLKVLESEVRCHSAKYRYGGTCDLVAEVNGELFVMDIKTGSVQASAFTQMAAYKAALMEVKKTKRIPGIENARLAVLNIHRDGDKAIKFITHEDFYKNSEMTQQDELHIFHCLRYIWAMRNIKSKKWLPTIKNMEDILSPLSARFKKKFVL